MPASLNIVVAACTNRGIGINGRLPWKLSGDMAFFKKITLQTTDATKKNAVLMGRKTWDSIPAKFRPLSNRINVIISSTLKAAGVYEDVYVVPSFEAAVRFLSSTSLFHRLERVFVIGGATVYKAAIESGLCERIYLTEVLKDFECDTFLPEFNSRIYQPIQETGINSEVQNDATSGVSYKFTVYKNSSNDSSSHLPVAIDSLPPVPLYVSVAIDTNRGFGLDGLLPWSLKKEFDHFVTLITNTSEPGKKVAVIKGRKTWESTSEFERNLPSLVNIVISRTMLIEQSIDVGKLFVVKSFNEAIDLCDRLLRNGTIEKTWVLGGVPVYQAALDSGLCRRVHITRIQATYNCDVFFPYFEHNFRKISDGLLEEDGVVMVTEIYEPLPAVDVE